MPPGMKVTVIENMIKYDPKDYESKYTCEIIECESIPFNSDDEDDSIPGKVAIWRQRTRSLVKFGLVSGPPAQCIVAVCVNLLFFILFVMAIKCIWVVGEYDHISSVISIFLCIFLVFLLFTSYFALKT